MRLARRELAPEPSEVSFISPSNMRIRSSVLNRWLLLLLLSPSLLLVGCATTGGIRSQPLSAGTARTFSGDFDPILKAARESVVESGLLIEDVTKMSETSWLIIGKKDASAFSWGELVRVSVEQQSPSVTIVRVLTQRKVATNVSAKGDYAQSILSNMELKLK